MSAAPALRPVLGDISNTSTFSMVASGFAPVHAVNPMLASATEYYKAMWACGVDFQPFRAMGMVQQHPQQQPENGNSGDVTAYNAVMQMNQVAPNRFVPQQTAMPMPALANVGVQYLNRQTQQQQQQHQQQQQQRLQLLQARQEQLYQLRPW